MRCFVNSMPDFDPNMRYAIKDKYWKQIIVSMVNNIVESMPPIFDNCDGGLYLGCAGIAYMLDYLANSEPFANDKSIKEEFLTRARNYADVSLSYAKSKANRDPPASFLLGSAGVFAVSSLVYSDIGEKKASDELNKKYLALAATCQPVNYLDCGSDELFVGRAGYMCGSLLLNRRFGQVVNKEAIKMLITATIHSGKTYATGHNSASPLMYAYYETEYLGAAHGLSSILQMLLCFPDILRADPAMETDVRGAVDFMLGLQQVNGNVPPAMDEVGRHRSEGDELVHWCHGAPGLIYLFARAYQLWKEPKYLSACLRCGELTWKWGLLKKGPGICHGIAGNGYVFLLLYRLTSDEKHIHRALKFAEFTQSDEFFSGARSPDYPYSLYEGLAGTVCFLTDLLQPQRAEFPFFDIHC